MKEILKIYKLVLPQKFRTEKEFYDCFVICATSERESIKLAIEKSNDKNWKSSCPVVQGTHTGRLKSSHVIASSFKTSPK